MPSEHPAVLANSQFFIESDKEETLPQLRPDPKPTPSSREPLVRAKRYMRLSGIVLPGGLRSAGITIIHEGDVLPRSHPAVEARPKDFEPVP